jgi:hypothetical protein
VGGREGGREGGRAGYYFSITLYDDSGTRILGSFPDFVSVPSRGKNPVSGEGEGGRERREGGREGNVRVCVCACDDACPTIPLMLHFLGYFSFLLPSLYFP